MSFPALIPSTYSLYLPIPSNSGAQWLLLMFKSEHSRLSRRGELTHMSDI